MISFSGCRKFQMNQPPEFAYKTATGPRPLCLKNTISPGMAATARMAAPIDPSRNWRDNFLGRESFLRPANAGATFTESWDVGRFGGVFPIEKGNRTGRKNPETGGIFSGNKNVKLGRPSTLAAPVLFEWKE